MEGLQVLTHGLPVCQRVILGMCLDCMVLEQLLGQWHISISNLSNSSSSDQGFQGPQQSLVVLYDLGQPLENTQSCAQSSLDYNPHKNLGADP